MLDTLCLQKLSMKILIIWLLNLSLLPTVLNANRRNGKNEEDRAEAIERLSQVFRLDKVPVLRHHRSPPQYMVELYNNVADNDGITKNRSPYGSNVVRGFPDRGKLHLFDYPILRPNFPLLMRLRRMTLAKSCFTKILDLHFLSLYYMGCVVWKTI